MRKLSCLLLACAALLYANLACAQTANDRELAVSRLSADLAALQLVPPSTNRATPAFVQCIGRAKTPRPESCAPLDHLRNDLDLIPGVDKQVGLLSIAVPLIGLLSGRELDERGVSLLSKSMVDAISESYRSRDRRESASESRKFQEAVLQTYAALYTLGVPETAARFVLSNFVSKADKFSAPHDVQPVPPARRNH